MIKSLNRQSIKLIISVIFVISGIAGLIYQIVWFKYLSLFLGNTTYAQMTVLATFLGGLAFGNFLFGKKSENFKNPIRVYSLLELSIGMYCLLYPVLSSFVGNLFISSVSGSNISVPSFRFSALRILVSAALLFLPATAMGGTLPVLSNFFVEKLNDARKEIAALYFLNSFGAVVGVVFAGFVFIKEFGLDLTIYITAIINLLAGIIGFILSRGPGAQSTESFLNTEALAENFNQDKTKIGLVVTIVAGISGFSALLYEMVWVRLLINFFGSSTYAFSIMLLAFISGITAGSFIISQSYLKKFNYVKLIAFFQGAIAFSTMLVLLFYDRLPYLLLKVAALFSRSSASFELFLAVEFIICFLMMLFPTLFMGMSLPVAAEIVSIYNKKIGVSVGNVFSANTAGTVIGVIVTGLILIPLLGIKSTFEVGILFNIAASLLLIIYSRFFSTLKKIVFVFIYGVTFLLYLVLFPSWNKGLLIGGVFRSLGSPSPNSFEEFSKSFNDEKIIFYEEGINATVAVGQSLTNPENRRLIINGKPDASTFYDMPTQVLLGQIPMMLHANPQKVFVVGFGSGTTIGSVLAHPVKKVVCAEISKEVISAAEYFKKENRNCINDPRLKVVNEDAVSLLKLSNENYDVIISEPSNPWIAGIGNLFSKEYFEKCSEKLNNNGIMVQWFHLYEADDDVVKLVLNTFSSVFPYSQLWSSVANDIILVGSKNDISFSPELLIKKFNSHLIKNDFKRIKIFSPFGFLFCQVSSPRGFFTMADAVPVNTEKHPLLEFWAPKAFYIGNPSSYIYSFDEKFDTLSSSLYIKKYAKLFPPSKEDLLNTAEYELNISKNYRAAYGLSKYLRKLFPYDYGINLVYSNALESLEIGNTRAPILEKLIRLYPDSVSIKKDYENILLNEKINATNFLHIFSIRDEAESFVKTTKPDTSSMLSVYIQLAKIYFQNSEFNGAKKMIDAAENYLRSSPQLVGSVRIDDLNYVAAMINLYENRPEKVFGYYLALINSNPGYENLFRLRRLVTWTLKHKS